MKTKSLLFAAFFTIGSLTALADNDPIHTGLRVLNGNSGVYKMVYEGEKSSSVNITIYNSKGILVYKETVRSIRGFIRPVNFKGMKADTYTIMVNSGRRKEEAQITYTP